MFDLGFGELLVLGIVALIVVGPKDLPGMFRTVGRFTGKAKAMAREFTSAMNAAADEAGVRDIDRTIRAAANPAKAATDAVRNTATSALKPGGETEKLSAERQEQAKKIREATAKAATERKAREAEEAAKAETAEAKPDSGKKPAAKKPAAKKTTAKKPAAKKSAPKKPAAPKDDA